MGRFGIVVCRFGHIQNLWAVLVWVVLFHGLFWHFPSSIAMLTDVRMNNLSDSARNCCNFLDNLKSMAQTVNKGPSVSLMLLLHTGQKGTLVVH